MVCSSRSYQRIYSSLVLTKGKKFGTLMAQTLSFGNLCQQPATRDDGVCLQKFGRRGGVHLGGYHAYQVLLGRQQVDGPNLTLVHHQLQYAGEALRLLALPVEVLADGDIVNGRTRPLRPADGR